MPRPMGAKNKTQGKIVDRDGYVLIFIPGHPLARKIGYVLEHRLVWWLANGKQTISKHTHIHHVNGDKQDNRIENLADLDIKEHTRITTKNINHDYYWPRECSTCGLRCGRSGFCKKHYKTEWARLHRNKLFTQEGII